MPSAVGASLLDEKQDWNEEKWNPFVSEAETEGEGGDFSMCMVSMPQPGRAVKSVPWAMGYCLGILRKKATVTQEAES